jgi:hypothetical protein
MASLTKARRNTVNLRKVDFTIGDEHSGILVLKVVIGKSQVDTRSTIMLLMGKLNAGVANIMASHNHWFYRLFDCTKWGELLGVNAFLGEVTNRDGFWWQVQCPSQELHHNKLGSVSQGQLRFSLPRLILLSSLPMVLDAVSFRNRCNRRVRKTAGHHPYVLHHNHPQPSICFLLASTTNRFSPPPQLYQSN